MLPRDLDFYTYTMKDYKADTNYVPYILDEFHYFFETPFENTDPDFSSCNLDRPSGSNGDGLMYIVNHFLQVKIGDIFIPNEILLPRTNAATGRGSIGAQVDVCKNKWGRKPKAVLVDRFNRGVLHQRPKKTMMLTIQRECVSCSKCLERCMRVRESR